MKSNQGALPPGGIGVRDLLGICIPMLLVALVIRLAVIPFVWDEWMQRYFVTHWEQGNVARALLAGQGFGSPFPSTQPSAIMAPVYPMIVAVLFKVFGVHTPASILATLSLNCVFSSLSCIPVYLVARRSFGPRVAKWAGWAWALSPYGIYFAAEWAWSTHLLILLMYWLLYLAQEMGETSKLAVWAGFGVVCGVAALTEPVALTVGPFLALAAAWQLWRKGRSWLLPGVTAALCLAATISPWVVRNYVVFGHFIPMRDSMGLELFIGNDGYWGHWVHADRHPNHDASELAEYQRGELAFMAHKEQEAKDYIRIHPAEFAWKSFRRAVYLWTGYWSFSKDYLRQEPLDPPNVLVATVLTLLGLLGLRKAFANRKSYAVMYTGMLMLFPAMYYFTHPQAYHMRPLDPLIAMLAVYFVVGKKEEAEQIVETPAMVESVAL